MKTIPEQIEVMQAFDAGADIEITSPTGAYIFNWQDYDYDIIRKPIEGWAWANDNESYARALCSSEERCRAMFENTSTSGRPVFMREVT